MKSSLKNCMVIFSAFVSLGLFAQGQTYTLKQKGQAVRNVYKIEGQRNGDLVVTFEMSVPPQTLKKGSYEKATAPEPSAEYDALDALIDRDRVKNNKQILKSSENLFYAFRFLGQGEKAGEILANTLFEGKKFKEALVVYQELTEVVDSKVKSKYSASVIMCQYELGEIDVVNKALPELFKQGAPAVACAYNINAKMALAKGKKDLAIFNYLKTATLFKEVESAKFFYEEACRQAAKLLQEKGDSRSQSLEL